MKKNKLFIVILIFFTLLIGFSSSCFASFDFNYNGTDYSLPDLPADVEGHTYAIGYDDYNRQYTLIISLDNQDMILDSSNEALYPNGNFIQYQKQSSNTTWQHFTTDTTDGGRIFGKPIYSNYDIKDSSGNVVFQKAPQLEGVLAPILEENKEEMNLEGVLKEILEILPVILVIIVGLISLRKGLQLLFMVLHQS